jgi:hypothetical protein
MRNSGGFFEKIKLKFTFWNAIKVFFLLILLVVHIRFVYNSMLVLPYYVSSISETVDAEIVSVYAEVDVNTASSRNRGKKTTFNVRTSFVYEGNDYTSSELISGFSYRTWEDGSKVKYTFITGLPSLGHIRSNLYFRQNHWMISGLLLLFDVFIFWCIPWIWKRYFRHNSSKEEISEDEKSELELLRERLKPFELNHSAVQEIPKISKGWANFISIMIFLSFVAILSYLTYDINILISQELYDDKTGLFFPSPNMVHLFIGIPFFVILSLILSRFLLYFIRPVGMTCEIWSIKDSFRSVNRKISIEKLLGTYDMQRILWFNLTRRKPLILALISALIWIGMVYWSSSSYVKVNDSGIEISTMYSSDQKSWSDIKLYRIALDEGRNDLIGSHHPVFDLVFDDNSFVNLWSFGLYNTDPKLLMRLIDHLEWRGLEAETFTLETMFGPEELGQLRDSYKKEIQAVIDYSKNNPYAFNKKVLKNTSEEFQSLFKDKVKTEDPGWTIKDSDYQKELNQ